MSNQGISVNSVLCGKACVASLLRTHPHLTLSEAHGIIIFCGKKLSYVLLTFILYPYN